MCHLSANVPLVRECEHNYSGLVHIETMATFVCFKISGLDNQKPCNCTKMWSDEKFGYAAQIIRVLKSEVVHFYHARGSDGARSRH